MTSSEAWTRLGSMLAYDAEPTLTDQELLDLLSMSQVVDSNGLAPSDDGWTPTYRLEIGAAEGWRWKAARVAGMPDFSTVGLSVSRSQLTKLCLDMATSYSRKGASTIPVYGQLARSDD